MPTQTTKTGRRRGATPVTKLQEDEVWRRVFEVMGLEPLSSTRNSSTTPSTSEAEAMATPTPTAPGAKPLSILDLPREIQKDIFKHASSADLIALSLVSKYFRDIAAQQLYRNFYIVFPDDDDLSNDSDIDGLAGGLDTFVTSDYNYAQYLREIVLETLSGGEKAEHVYRHYLYDVSCGKFMNTLLLLTLRKATALETFRWDIRVELSRQIFKALHQIDALQHLHLRMQVGNSIYQEPPPIPSSSSFTSGMDLMFSPQPSNPNLISIPAMPPGYSSNSFSLVHQVSSKSRSKAFDSIMPSIKTPPTLSGFKNLKTLSILDMDSLEYINELKVCVRNCSSSLNTLKLSFSEELANKSRKPPPEVQSDDDSDQEDEFGQVIIPGGPPPQLGGASDPNAPSKALKALDEKKKQEAVMARIFGMETHSTYKHKPAAAIKDDVQKKLDDPKKQFVRSLAPLAARLMEKFDPGSEVTEAGKETLEMIAKASKLYLANADKGKDKDGEASGNSTSKPTPASSNAGVDDGAEEVAVMSGAAAENDGPGLFDNVDKKKKKATSSETGVADPDDIDVEEPEGTELTIEPGHPENDPEEVAEEDEVKEVSQVESASNLMDDTAFLKKVQALESYKSLEGEEMAKERESIYNELEDFKLKVQAGDVQGVDMKKLEEAEAEFTQAVLRYEAFGRHADEIIAKKLKEHDLKEATKSPLTSTHSKMKEYVRSTRGLTLKTLAIYLIPIKVSVLSRAIDVHVLQEITLLNVGPQVPFWNLLARENKTGPLPLRKIYTDNVTLAFLVFVSQLETVTELLLLERTKKARVESTAAQTTVTIEQIRKIVLKKHARNLKVLMIRNDASMDWDFSVEATMTLCQRAKNLEELACSFGVRTVHTLLQFLPSLTSLRVLHTIQYRADDTCPFVALQFRKFIVDSTVHAPDTKLEYIALDTSVERLVRRKPREKDPKKDRKGKAKTLMTWIGGPGASSSTGGSASASGLGNDVSGSVMPDWQDSSDDENEASKTGLKVETVEGARFCDIIGVRLFEKDVLNGRL